jgi:hypothetical protein
VIWASCEFNGFDLDYLPVLNPAACRGKTWLIEIGGCMPVWVVVESETVSDAIEVLSDDPEFGHGVHVRDEDFAAYSEEERRYDRYANLETTVQIATRIGGCLPDTTVSHVPIADNRMGTPESIKRRLGFSDQDNGVDRLLNCAAAAVILPSRRTLEAAIDRRRRSPSGLLPMTTPTGAWTRRS